MWSKYIPIHQRKKNNEKKMGKLKKNGKKIEPVVIEKTIAKEFWGKKWCSHFEGFADYSNRLPRGKTYVRNGSVCHLSIEQGKVEAFVSGSALYTVSIQIKTLPKNKWEVLKKKCSGVIGSILELLQGKISQNVMQIVSNVDEGLFPHPSEISYSCSCPDFADMCKHVAAVLYGIGNRLDKAPELLFLLRGVDPMELVSTQLNIESSDTKNILESENLSELFGIEIDTVEVSKNSTPTGKDLKQFRILKKISVIELAKALEVAPASIYRWENIPGEIKMQSKHKKALLDLMSSGT